MAKAKTKDEGKGLEDAELEICMQMLAVCREGKKNGHSPLVMLTGWCLALAKELASYKIAHDAQKERAKAMKKVVKGEASPPKKRKRRKR